MDLKIGDTIRVIKNLDGGQFNKYRGVKTKVIGVSPEGYYNLKITGERAYWRREEIELCNKEMTWI